MSAPSKEEIAAVVAQVRRIVSGCKIDYFRRSYPVLVALADENERLLTDLREEVETNVELRAKLDSVRDENERLANELKAAQLDWDRLALENERLRAENEIAGTAADMGRNTMAAQSDEIGRLRAERAECIALLEDAKPNEYGEQHAAEWRRKRSALVAKLRGQS